MQELYNTYHLESPYPSLDDFLETYKPYNFELWDLYGRGEINKERLQFERFYHTIELLPLPHDRLVAMAQEMGPLFLQLTNKYFSLLPEASRVVRYLASKYPLTIISNGFKEVQYYKLSASGLQDCFAHVLISEEIGVNKPQPEIFQIALERNHVQPSEAIMIGDRYSSDIQGAKAAGIDQIWIHEDDPSISEKQHFASQSSATFIVPSLTDVMTIL